MNYDAAYAANEKTKKKGVGSVHISRGLWSWAGACTRCPTTLSRLATIRDFQIVQLDTVVKGTTRWGMDIFL